MTSGETDPVLHADLARLADVARREIDASGGSVAAGFSQAAWEACDAITDRLVAAGVAERVAQHATTAWIILRGPSVWECLVKVETDEPNR